MSDALRLKRRPAWPTQRGDLCMIAWLLLASIVGCGDPIYELADAEPRPAKFEMTTNADPTRLPVATDS